MLKVTKAWVVTCHRDGSISFAVVNSSQYGWVCESGRVMVFFGMKAHVEDGIVDDRST